MKKEKKTYSTPEGLQYAASCQFSNASLAWIANLIWQFLMLYIHVSGIASLVLNLVGFALLLYGAVTAYNAFEYEIQADAMQNSQPDRALRVMKKGVMVCIVIRSVLTVLSILCGLLLDSVKGTGLYQSVNALINIFGNIFSSVNILGIYAYQIYVHDGYDSKIKIFSLLSLVSVIAHLLLAELRYFIELKASAPNALSYTALLFSVISYFALYLMFEARKALRKPSPEKETSEAE